MPDFLVRNLDATLWRHFRERAEREGHTLKWILTALITHYIKHGLPKSK